MISIITTMTAFFLIISCLLFAYILRTCPREKVHISVEEARENRRAHLVARRIRFREAGCCTRCLLKCLFSFEDVCCCAEKVSKCFGRAGRENKKDLTRVSLKSHALECGCPLCSVCLSVTQPYNDKLDETRTLSPIVGVGRRERLIIFLNKERCLSWIVSLPPSFGIFMASMAG